MTTPEPRPLSEQELKALEEYTWSLACCVCVGPDADGNHDDDCQAPFWQKVSRAIAQARAARPSPRLLSRADAEDKLTDAVGGQMFGLTPWVKKCLLDWLFAQNAPPSPPAQDGGRP